MASLVAPCPALQPRGSSAPASSFFRAPAPSCADRVCFDPSGVLVQADTARDGKRRRRHGDDDDSRASKKQAVRRVASPVAHLSCARIRPFVCASRPKTEEETQVVRDKAQEVITKKQNTGESISSKKIEPAAQASRPTKETSSSTQVSARTIARGVTMKQKAGENIPCTRIRPTVGVQPSGLKDKMMVSSAGVLSKEAHGMIKTKQDASERVQATVTNSIPQIRPPEPEANHQDPHAPRDALRAALAVARQARDRRHQNVYRQEREEARRELDKVVRTVFFNDPYISLENVLKP